MEKRLVFGHKSPDTDTVCSALVYADLKKKLGEDFEAVRLGTVNEETKFALDYFGVEAPRQVETVSNEVNEVALVDHNEPQQSVDDLKDVRIVEVVDHHRISNFESAEPLYFRVEPVGCTATILRKMYKENGVEIEKSIAGLMLSCIISDTLLLKSPTCTQEDIDTAKELSEIAGVDLDAYGLDMLKAGANTKDTSAADLISLDAKEFPMGDAKVEIAQVNVVDTEEVLARKEELKDAMTSKIDDKGLNLFVLAITDILKNDSTVLALGKNTEKVEEAFNTTLQDDVAVLEGVVSRKKQIVPPLTNAFKG
ncbi:manganese-dependent inorganic pyrophosphatase [Thalassobacillus hwangdonensis]|uniref:Probable manganese-dependent inorganic pyrophosphatase n=1 Tax=Thalassobacillus hwangdonensis TaxID=546108 RepID=A0ABW3L1P7_9BACI